MQARVVPRTPECLACAFNGSLLAVRSSFEWGDRGDGVDTRLDAGGRPFQLLNVYRNSAAPGGPCHVTVKRLTVDPDTLETMTATFDRHLARDARHEDPRVMPWRLSTTETTPVLTCNDVSVHDDAILRVRVRSYDAKMRPISALPSPPESALAPWEKNWMLVQQWVSGSGWVPRVLYALYPEVVVLDETGAETKRVAWTHPSDQSSTDQPLSSSQPPPSCVMHWRRARSFRRVRDLFVQTTSSSFEKLSFHIRGGAHPIWLAGRWWVFAHTRERDGRLYRPIVLLMDDAFSVMAATPPITVPGFEHARIVYPMGAVYDRGTDVWYVSCGLDDEDQVLIKWPRADLMSRLQPVGHF